MTWKLTYHAIERFRERHAPHLDLGICAQFLHLATESAELTEDLTPQGDCVWRGILSHPLLGEAPARFGIVAVPRRDGGEGFVAVTILPAGEDRRLPVGIGDLAATSYEDRDRLATLVASMPSICNRCRSEVLRALREQEGQG